MFQRSSMFAFVLIALLAGCNTSPPKPVLSEPLILKTADLTVELVYLDEDVIEERHGHNDARQFVNPYYGYPGLITKKRLLVFDMKAYTTESSINFKLEDIDLTIGRIGGDAKSRHYLSTIWEHYAVSARRLMDGIMKKTLLKREFTVSLDNPVSGYLVFGENYPQKGGTGMITMNVESSNGDQGILEIPVDFTVDGTVSALPQNSGIFEDAQ